MYVNYPQTTASVLNCNGGSGQFVLISPPAVIGTLTQWSFVLNVDYYPVTCQPSQPQDGYGGSRLDICGGNLSAGTTVDLIFSHGLPNNTWYLLAALTPNPIPIPLGCAGVCGAVISITPDVLVAVPTNAFGGWHIPGIPGGGGPVTFHVQGAYFDPLLTGGIGVSNSLQVTFLP